VLLLLPGCVKAAYVCVWSSLLLQSENSLFSDSIDSCVTNKPRQNVVMFELLYIVISIVLFLLRYVLQSIL